MQYEKRSIYRILKLIVNLDAETLKVDSYLGSKTMHNFGYGERISASQTIFW